MYKTIQKTWSQDKDLPSRAFLLAMRRRVFEGRLYDNLPHPFHYEISDSGEYIPLRKRRPCVRTNLCRTVVEDSVSLLFAEGKFPAVEIADETQKAQLPRVLKEIRLNETMIDAATRGSVGSIAILLRVLEGRIFLKVMNTEYLTPLWRKEAPDTLLSVTEKYKVDGKALRAAGYAIADDDLVETFWFQRVWDDAGETWFVPWKVSGDAAIVPVVDTANTVSHQLGFVPLVWIKNLPGGDDIDGKCTFPDEAIDVQIEIDYQLSQAGRALKFMGDPTLVIRGETDMGSDGPIVRGAANALKVGAEGDVKLLEISGESTTAVLEYVKQLRESALELMHGNRASNEKISGAQSGRAMELMNQALIWLADRLRISYGEGAILDLVSMIVRASIIFPLKFRDGSPVGKFDEAQPASLRWPCWFTPTLQDMLLRANTLRTLCDAALLSRETATKILCAEYDIENPAAEKLLIDAELVEESKNTAARTHSQI